VLIVVTQPVERAVELVFSGAACTPSDHPARER
jgi:hypothetical protein